MLEKGILLVALNHPYYGRMAYNLAMSIKAIDQSVDISVIYSDGSLSHINDQNIGVFDRIINYDLNNSSPYGVKLELDKLTPYEKTLYLDVDTLWINKNSPALLFEQLNGIQFTGITEGFYNFDEPDNSDLNKSYFLWADAKEMQDLYALTGKIYQWRSEFFYFEKTDTVSNFFNIARNLYTVEQRDKKLKSTKMFGDYIPDELVINMAANMCDIHPHTYKWKATFWDKMNGDYCPPIEELYSTYYLLSCGSNTNSPSLKRTYDRIVRACAYRLGLQHVFPLLDKRQMIKERQSI